MKKTILVTAALSFGLLGGLVSTNTSASAATTHKGLPHSLINTKWHAKTVYTARGRETSKLHFHKTTISGEWAGGVDPFGVSKVRYKYTGHHTYKLYAREYGNAPINGYAWRGKVKIYNSHKIYFKDYSTTWKYTNTIYQR
ncbi:hypothetical protein ACFP1H_02665 [Secundilactobacillus hailunensis]|uniref:Uncharacterized protein n=1 Tax=Secundilactobacillus hailunensis TaxID=2559923 RepID=A0ABW1T6H2_9LACO|nr:hypothetical protein [Secundilactobacillus hailunensis]